MHARFGKNLGRYFGETIPIQEIQAQIHEAALETGWTAETFLTGPQPTLFAYQKTTPGATKNIYISAGIHGDEPSGPLALLALLRENLWPPAQIWLVPCLNPTGFLQNTRENAQGIDLNRDYRHFRSREVTAHVAWLRRQPHFDLSLLLHEDWEANGFYVYELNQTERPSLAETIVEAARQFSPIEHCELVDNFECRGGVIRPKINPVERPEWAEAVYLFVNKSRRNYTLETPSDYPLPMRVQTHYEALLTALKAPEFFFGMTTPPPEGGLF